jgi:hypothetical protein
MDFKDSALIKNLQDGKLPDVNTNISIDSKAITNLVVGIVVAGLAIILIYKLIR